MLMQAIEGRCHRCKHLYLYGQWNVRLYATGEAYHLFISDDCIITHGSVLLGILIVTTPFSTVQLMFSRSDLELSLMRRWN